MNCNSKCNKFFPEIHNICTHHLYGHLFNEQDNVANSFSAERQIDHLCKRMFVPLTKTVLEIISNGGSVYYTLPSNLPPRNQSHKKKGAETGQKIEL